MPPLDVDHSARSPQRNNRGSYPSASSTNSLTREHIQDALAQSPDNGATLVFLKKDLKDLSAEMAEELATIGRESPEDESCVERIALGSNRLATLPMEFALLSKLRYVNLKSNSFSTFPDVLTMMPALDTLDISQNKIKRLPSQPGHLVNLRVFSLTKNKLTRLPAYLSQFTHLVVLETERNPIEWPPRSVMQRPAQLVAPEAMEAWIRNLQKWIEADSQKSVKNIEDSGFLEQRELETNLSDSLESWSRFPLAGRDVDDGVTPHARSFSVDSTLSISSIAESEIETPSSSYDQSTDGPPALHLGILRSYSPEASPTRSMESYLPSPAESETFFGSSSQASQQQQQSPQQHGRNASYASGAQRALRPLNLTATLPGKKSLPDLRTAKLNLTKTIPEVPERPHPLATSTPTRTRVNVNEDFSIPSPLSLRQDSGSSSSSRLNNLSKHAPPMPLSNLPITEAPLPSTMAFERNSYFRRLSSLPSAAISNSLPKPLLGLIDSVRSILFAVCQVYQSLEHYTIHAIDDRLSSVLRKVLEPASSDMMQLINALDRFDVMSRKTIPPAHICRGVVESCKDTVSAFGKTVGVLSLQIKVIAAGDDARYLRAMLLTLYGASAEVSAAWNGLVPQLMAIKPHLQSKPFNTPSPPNQSTIGSETPFSAPINTVPFQWGQSPALPTLRTPSSGSRMRPTLRRHAGSFSYKDVEIGRALPSHEEPPPPMLKGVALHTPTLRTPGRSRTLASPLPASPQPMLADSSKIHSRSTSQASLTQGSSASSSPSIPAPKNAYLELPSSSKAQVDKQALDAVQKAVSVAPEVWVMIEQMMPEVLESKPDVRIALQEAKTTTKRLADLIKAIQDGDAFADKKSLRQDADLFLKSVVRLSNVIKTHGNAQSTALRSRLVKLTNFTEEFAILLHVSTFAPPTQRPYSPMMSPSVSSPSLAALAPSVDESRFPSSLARSRSAQPTVTTFKGIIPPFHEGTRSALPNQSFKVPINKQRFRGRDDPG